MSRARVTPVVSLPQPTSWSQVAEQALAGGHIFVAYSVFGEQAKAVGKTIAQALSALETTEHFSSEEWYEFLQDCDRVAVASGVVLHLSGCFCSADELVCGAIRGVVYLRRAGKLGKAVVAGEHVELRIGRPQTDDFLVLATLSSGSFLQEVEQKFAQGFEPDTIITSIIPGVQAADESHHASLAFVYLGEAVLKKRVEVVPLTTTPVTTRPSPTTSSPTTSSPTIESAAEQELPQGTSDLSATTPEKTSDGKKRILASGVSIARATARARTFFTAGRVRASQLLFGARSFLNRAVLALKPRKAGVYLGKDTRRKWFITTGVLVIVLSSVIGAWVYYARSQERARQAALQLIAPFEERLTTAESLVGTDPLAAREQVATTVAELESLHRASTPSAITARIVLEKLERAKNLYGDISGKEELAELPVFYDLRLIESDFVATLAQGAGEQAVFIDRDKQQAAILNLESKQLSLISLDAVGSVTSAVLLADTLYILGDGVYSAAATTDAVPVQRIPQGDSNAGGVFIGAYEQYLYVLNPEKRNVYRYLKQGEEYSQPIGWLASSLGTTLDDVVSLAIDGDLWLATQTGEIKKFTSGREQDFSVQGMSELFDSPLYIVTTVDLERVYVLEADRNRVVILAKDGTFLREIKHTALGSATALVVSERLQKAFALSGSMVFEIAL